MPPKAVKKRVTVEAASPIGWDRWAAMKARSLGSITIGASAPGEDNHEALRLHGGACRGGGVAVAGAERGSGTRRGRRRRYFGRGNGTEGGTFVGSGVHAARSGVFPRERQFDCTQRFIGSLSGITATA